MFSSPIRLRARAVRSTLPLPVLIACLAWAVIAMFPAVANAGTYSLPRVHIEAQVEKNGDLLVTEARTFQFEDTVNGVYWDIPRARNAQGQPSSVTVFGVQELNGAPADVDEAHHDAEPMREVSLANPGDRHVYTVENEADSLRLKVFVPRSNGGEVTLWVSYMIEGAVMAWPDTAELYWKFIGSEWEEDADNVSLDVTFAGAGRATPATVGDEAANLRAWGHGPLDGEVSLDVESPANPHVRLNAPTVRSGQFAEVRVAFPTDWVPDLTPSGSERLDTILSEEASWADEANARRARARVISAAIAIVFAAVPAGLLILAVHLRRTKYASPRPVFDETYFRDLPSDDHPAVLSALVHDGAVKGCAFVATLMKLTDDRVIKIEHDDRTESRFLGLGEKKVEEYSIELVARERVVSPIDMAAIDLYFGPSAKNGDRMRFGELQHLETAGECMEEFEENVRAELERRNLTDHVSIMFRAGFIFAPVAVTFIGIFLIAMTDGASLPFVLAGIVLAIASAVVASGAKQYSAEAVELRTRCRALERWLVDFTNLDEAVPDDLILWSKMLVLAAAFGVSEEVLRRLADSVPANRRMDEDGMYYYPSYWWYYSHGNLHPPMGDLHDAYQATVSELSSSSNSSGSGFGGGFSGGGGGGVGGGGGGTF